jgi:hypothetical protein
MQLKTALPTYVIDRPICRRKFAQSGHPEFSIRFGGIDNSGTFFETLPMFFFASAAILTAKVKLWWLPSIF